MIHTRSSQSLRVTSPHHCSYLIVKNILCGGWEERVCLCSSDRPSLNSLLILWYSGLPHTEVPAVMIEQNWIIAGPSAECQRLHPRSLRGCSWIPGPHPCWRCPKWTRSISNWMTSGCAWSLLTRSNKASVRRSSLFFTIYVVLISSAAKLSVYFNIAKYKIQPFCVFYNSGQYDSYKYCKRSLSIREGRRHQIMKIFK